MWVKSFIKVILCDADVICIRFPQPCQIFISSSKSNPLHTLASTYNNIFIKNKCKPRQPGSRSWWFLSRLDGLVGNTKLSMSCLLWMSWNVKSPIIDLYCSPRHNMLLVVLVSFIVSRPHCSNYCGSLSRPGSPPGLEANQWIVVKPNGGQGMSSHFNFTVVFMFQVWGNLSEADQLGCRFQLWWNSYSWPALSSCCSWSGLYPSQHLARGLFSVFSVHPGGTDSQPAKWTERLRPPGRLQSSVSARRSDEKRTDPVQCEGLSLAWPWTKVLNLTNYCNNKKVILAWLTSN